MTTSVNPTGDATTVLQAESTEADTDSPATPTGAETPGMIYAQSARSYFRESQLTFTSFRYTDRYSSFRLTDQH